MCSIMFRLILLAFFGSIGLTFIILACALQQYSNWYPLFVLLFHVLAFILYVLSQKNFDEFSSTSNVCHEICWFFIAGAIVSAFALPIVLAGAPVKSPVIRWGACSLTVVGNIIIFLTIFGYFKVFGNDDFNYFAW